jgi:hypothetical protein
MIVLAGVVSVVLLLATSAVVSSRRRRSLSPILVPWEELLNQAIECVSTVYMDELREMFRPQAYGDVTGDVFPLTRNIQPGHIERMERNIKRLENLGMRTMMFTLGEDVLAQELIRRATGCRLLLQPIKSRVRIYNALPFFMWKVMGNKMAHTCVYGGAQLIREYEDLVNAALAFVRARGEDYQYDTLLAAL